MKVYIDSNLEMPGMFYCFIIENNATVHLNKFTNSFSSQWIAAPEGENLCYWTANELALKLKQLNVSDITITAVGKWNKIMQQAISGEDSESFLLRGRL